MNDRIVYNDDEKLEGKENSKISASSVIGDNGRPINEIRVRTNNENL